MNESTIGIKIADGTYYPILQENIPVKKKVILTTVNDGQTDVQIDLYKGSGTEISEAVYIGSIVIDNIETAEKGAPEIELRIGIDGEGTLDASAGDVAAGEYQNLSVSLESLSENSYEMPDFEIDDNTDEQDILTPKEEEQLSMDSYGTEVDESVEEKSVGKKRNPLLLAAFIVLGLVIICIAAYFVLQMFKGTPNPDLIAGADSPGIEEEVTTEVPAADETTAEVAAVETASEESSVETASEVETTAESVPAVETDQEASSGSSTPKGILYVIRRGDTLWDISSSFYRTPWLYGKIAKDNAIPDPDLIYSGSDLYIYETK